MRLLIAATGTPGALEAALAIAAELQGAGDRVRLCAPQGLGAVAAPFELAPIEDPRSELGVADALIAAADECAAIIAHVLVSDVCAIIAEALRVPLVVFTHDPLCASSRRDRPTRAHLRWLRARLSLPLVSRAPRAPTLGIHSSTLAAGGTGLVGPSSSLRHTVGTAFSRALPPWLARWLAARAAPLFVGDLPIDREIVAAEAAARGVPVLFEPTGVDSSLLLPRCVAALHSASLGNVTAIAKAGVPAIACHASHEETHWAHRVERLGVGAALRTARANRRRIGAALDRVLDASLQLRACEVGALMRAEDGASVIVRSVRDAIREARASRRGLRLVLGGASAFT